MYYGNSGAGSASSIKSTFPQAVDFSSDTVIAYGGSQDTGGTGEWEVNGSENYIRFGLGTNKANNWKAFNVGSLSITSGDYMLMFDYRSDSGEAEISGVGHDTETTSIEQTKTYQVEGTQSWGLASGHITQYDRGTGGWQAVEAVLNDYTGSYSYITIAHDNDAGPNTDDYFRNIRVRKYVSSEPADGVWGTEESNITPSVDYAVVSSYTGANKKTVNIGGSFYDIYTFPTGTSTITFSQAGQVDYLIVGGGGGGAGRTYTQGGGGGAGGLLSGTTTVSTSSLSITVGSGGLGSDTSGTNFAVDGENSSFNGLTAIGGGRGGSRASPPDEPGSGGSGGGSYNSGIGVRGAGTPGQGFDGGLSTTASGKGAGGGGAGEQGGDTTTDAGGAGGAGLYIDITGVSVGYAGGGGGAADSGPVGAASHGGGTGGRNGVPPSAGVDGLGGGGGGGYPAGAAPNGAKGGDGTVILRVAHPDYAVVSSALGATKSTVSIDGTYYDVYTFPTGTSTVTFSQVGYVDYLVVAGGGGGGGREANFSGKGGGGGGGFLSGTILISTSTSTYDLTVGTGGTGGTNGQGTQGNNSDFSLSGSSVVSGPAVGGGYGAYQNLTGGDGGSGGGGAPTSNAGGTATAGQGYNGGAGSGGGVYYGGGGGGAGAAGSDAVTGGGDGGDGVASSIMGTSVTYAGGGGGGSRAGGDGGGTGGAGGGGAGGDNAAAGTDGTDGLGGGGGGAGSQGSPGGDGGDGVVILRVTSTNIPRKLKLFEGHTIKIQSGRLKIQ